MKPMFSRWVWLLAALALLAWLVRDQPALRPAKLWLSNKAAVAAEAVPVAMPSLPLVIPTLPAAAPSVPAPAPATLRKCILPGHGKVLYTNESCPAGSQAATVSRGTVTVVPAPAGVPPSAPADMDLKSLRVERAANP
jgi:hypothetical protein